MLCEKCGIREANIRYTEVYNGVKTEHNLCSQCAREMDLGAYSAILEGEFPLGKLLSSLLGVTDSTAAQQPQTEVVCPTCRTTYGEFIKNSCFGCADCYHVFDPLIREKIRKLQGNAAHTGKHPRIRRGSGAGAEVTRTGQLELSREEQLNQLKRQLAAALEEENYEEAALLRDRIRALKGEEKHDEVV